MKINELKSTKISSKKAKRVGRGSGSGLGKTAGRGVKGQKSRSGVSINGFEGGQMPIYMRLPKRGFNVPHAKRYAIVNLGRIQDFIDRKKIDPNKEINEEVLLESGLVTRKHTGIRVLAKGSLTTKVSMKVTGASKSAILEVEKHGGSCLIS